ncbi:lysosomal beta glucosidase isoform X3 [Spatholobus suberectus]|nr:lysosomal beta glucosidase isoform X3 [Spatholobus suberectus]
MRANLELITNYLKSELQFKGYVISDSQEHRKLEGDAIQKSLVLLKNGKSTTKSLLPLPKKSAKIQVAGSHANKLDYQCGAWTITWKGLGGNDLIMGTKDRDIHADNFSFEQIGAATIDISSANKIGEFGFGPVYKVFGYNFQIILFY